MQSTSSRFERNGLAFGARVVGAAYGSLGIHGVLNHDVDHGGAGHAKAGGHGRVRQVKLAILAEDSADRLTSSALGGRPLRLLITRWAGIRAVRALGAAV